jgi:Protein of unknown function (DUF2946)
MHFLRKLTLKSKALQFTVVRAAIFAVLLNAWAPTVTALLASVQGRPVALSEHCLRMPEHCVAGPGTSNASDGQGLAHDGKNKEMSCAFCFAHAGSFGLTPVIHAPQVAATTRYAAPSQIIATPATRQAWLHSRPRGPPILS